MAELEAKDRCGPLIALVIPDQIPEAVKLKLTYISAKLPLMKDGDLDQPINN